MPRKKTKDETDFRSAKMKLLLYPDDVTHVEAMKRIKENYDYAYILHDKDKKDDNDEHSKKEHWHVVLRFKNAQWNTSLSNDLGIEKNYIRNSNDIDKALQYLIHYNDSDKHKYDINEVVGPLQERLKMSLNKYDRTEEEEVQLIMNYIVNSTSRMSITDLSIFCVQNGYWASYRRAQNLFRLMLNEHNDELWQKHLNERMEEDWSPNYSTRTGEVYSTPFDYEQAEFMLSDAGLSEKQNYKEADQWWKIQS